MLKKKRYLVLVLIPVCIALVAFTPFLLSTSSSLQFFVKNINKTIPGKVSAESWLIGWQQGILCQNITYINPVKGVKVTIPSLTSNKGLLELLLVSKDLGVIHVESPQVELSGPSLAAFFAHGIEGESINVQKNLPLGESSPPWDQISVELKSRGGLLKTDWAKHDTTITLKNMSIDSTLAGGVTTFDIEFQAMDQGFVKASGSLNLPAHEQEWFETIITDMEVKISSLQLDQLLQDLGKVSHMPQGEGMLNADFQLKAVGSDDIELGGVAELSDLHLSGGFLGDDQPSFKKIHVALDQGRWTGRDWSAKGFDLVSDTLDLKVSVEVLPDTTKITSSGNLRLPVLFDQFPRLLRIHESSFLETGILHFILDLGSSEQNLNVKLKANAEHLGGIFEEQRFVWDSPVSLYCNIAKEGGELQVNGLQFDAPFARFKGSGDLYSFAMDAEMDLDKTFADIGKLFQFDLSGSGKAELAVKNSQTEDGRFRVDVDFNIHDFMLQDLDKEIVPLHQFSFIGGIKAPDAFIETREGTVDIQMVLSSWFGEQFLVMNGDKKGDTPFRWFYSTDAELYLSQMTSLLQTFKLVTGKKKMAGTLQLQAAGFAGGKPMEIRDLSAEVTDFVQEENDGVFSVPRMTAEILQPANEEVDFLFVRDLKVAAGKESFFQSGAGLNLIDLSENTVTLHNVQLETGAEKTTIERLELVAVNDSAADRLIMKTSGDRQVISGVEVSVPAWRKLLSNIHPLFGVLTEPDGTINVQLDSFSWPLSGGGKHEADFVVILDVRELKLKSKSQLTKTLDAFGLKGKELLLRDNEIYCIGRNSRVKCSPVRLIADGTEIVVGGAVLMDSSLDYEVTIPVTRKLVSGDVFQVLEGRKVKIGLKGTVKDSNLERETITASVENLLSEVRADTGKEKDMAEQVSQNDV